MPRGGKRQGAGRKPGLHTLALARKTTGLTQPDTMGFNARELEVAELLAEGNSAREIQRRTGIAASTVGDWLKNPAFVVMRDRHIMELMESRKASYKPHVPQALANVGHHLQKKNPDMSKWVLEMVQGKPLALIATKSDITIHLDLGSIPEDEVLDADYIELDAE